MPASRIQQTIARLADLTPRAIVAELDRYIVGQEEAKKAVAIALRNRWRRQVAPEAVRGEIASNNIILIGPTGSGKTEIARRLAKLAGAPFVKVEASKFTEVGYVGRDVDAMIRDLAERAVDMVRSEREGEVEELAQERVDERLLDLLLARHEEAPAEPAPAADPLDALLGAEPEDEQARWRRTRDRLRQLMRDGLLEDREVELEVEQRMAQPDRAASGGAPDGYDDFAEFLRTVLPVRKVKRRMKAAEARRILLDEELAALVDEEDVIADALERVEALGIVFLDEIDKIAGGGGPSHGPDVSREGVQRDLLPIVEGSNVPTRYGMVKTDHILFVAAGAFHVSKPSDLIPELQGRFPIRVELKPLTEPDFVRIMTEPENALTRQYEALVAAEQATLRFTEDGIAEIARSAAQLNQRMENIGARRLHTVMTTLLEEALYELPERGKDEIVVDAAAVRERLRAIMEDEDLRKYIL